MNGLVHPAVDLGLAAGVALVAWRLRALTVSGAVAATLVGWAHATGGGVIGTAALLTFFATSTLLSRIGKRRKEALGFEKGGTRDAAQVLANGGVATLSAVGIGLWPGNAMLLATMLGALATANADTWATEIGSLWGRNPRRITDWKPARSGESGAVSAAGTAAALAGAFVLAAVGAVVTGDIRFLLTATIAGFAGALFDSLLGATVQSMRRCPSCDARTEAREHCGVSTAHAGGIPWMNNDAVNACATLAGAILAAGVVWLLNA
jgi:uncharacterized protein (TIGR00297 family)